MYIKNLLQSYIGKRVVLTSVDLSKICREWDTYSATGDPLSGDGMIEFEEHQSVGHDEGFPLHLKWATDGLNLLTIQVGQ